MRSTTGRDRPDLTLRGRFRPHADARIYAERVNARIVLIDGPELAQLMVEHNCEVRVEETFVLKEVDEEFFDES